MIEVVFSNQYIFPEDANCTNDQIYWRLTAKKRVLLDLEYVIVSSYL